MVFPLSQPYQYFMGRHADMGCNPTPLRGRTPSCPGMGFPFFQPHQYLMGRLAGMGYNPTKDCGRTRAGLWFVKLQVPRARGMLEDSPKE